MSAADLIEVAGLLETCAAKLRALAGDPGASTRSPAPQRQTEGQARAPFGRSKGELLSALPQANLEWLRGALNRSIDDPEKSKYRRKNESDLANVVRAQLRSRASGAAPSTPPEAEEPAVEAYGGSDDIPF